MLLTPVGIAIAQPESGPCADETLRALGVTQIEADRASELQAVCPAGSLERVNLTAAVGGDTRMSFEFQQSAFDQAIYHLEVRDAAQSPVDWIVATPEAGEIDSLSPAKIDLLIRPPAALVSSVQAVTIGVSIHDGTRSWSRDLELQITVGDEQPLFRDRFEIDPVIGQFSQRPSKSRRIHLISAQPFAGR